MKLEELDLRGLDAINKLIENEWTIQINHHMSVMTKYLNPEWYEEKEIYNVQMGQVKETILLESRHHSTIRECFEELNERAKSILSKEYLE